MPGVTQQARASAKQQDGNTHWHDHTYVLVEVLPSVLKSLFVKVERSAQLSHPGVLGKA